MMSFSTNLPTNLTFTDIYNNAEDFVNDYKTSGLYIDAGNDKDKISIKISDDSATTLYYLLYARYGNSTVQSSDENQFKYKLASIIFQYGPAWEKKLEIQDNLKALTMEELELGSKLINNHALNPSTQPSTNTQYELDKIDAQTVTLTKRGKLEAYNNLLALLSTDVTEAFIKKFQKLFIQFTYPANAYTYTTP